MSLPAPKLPTLEELVARGDDPEHYLWMQCQIAETSSRGVITGFEDTEEFDLFTSVTFRDENDTWFDPALIVPLPDAQRLEWPARAKLVTEDDYHSAPTGTVVWGRGTFSGLGSALENYGPAWFEAGASGTVTHRDMERNGPHKVLRWGMGGVS